MLAASQTESLSPRYKAHPKPDLFCQRPLVETRIGTVGPDRRLRDEQHGLDNDTIQIVFRSRPGSQTPPRHLRSPTWLPTAPAATG